MFRSFALTWDRQSYPQLVVIGNGERSCDLSHKNVSGKTKFFVNAIGSVVEIFGSHIPLEQMAAELHTIPYEIISLISGRVTRLYRKNGKISSESNERILKSEI